MKSKFLFVFVIAIISVTSVEARSPMVSTSHKKIGTTTSGGGGYTRVITIDHTKVGGTLTNFPFLFMGTYTYLRHTSYGGNVTSSDGYDILLTDTNGNKYNFEKERYDQTTGEIALWCRLPEIGSITDFQLKLYYGSSSITTYQGTTTGVWDSNYKGVWHHSETSGTTVYDSTAGAYNASVIGEVTLNVTAPINGGDQFNGSSARLETNDNIYLYSQFSSSGGTMECWMKSSASQAAQFVSVEGYWVIGMDATGYFRGITDGASWKTSSTLINNGAWRKMAMVFSPTEIVALYVDGTAVLSNQATTLYDIDSVTNGVGLGAHPNGAEFFNGYLDECRVSNIQRSAGWITTEHNNQSSPSTFYSVGAEQ